MSRTTLVIDEELLKEAMKLTHAKSKKEAVELSLAEMVRKKRREKALEHAGAIDIDLTLDELLKLRREG